VKTKSNMSKFTSEPGTLRMSKSTINHMVAATSNKKSLFDRETFRLPKIPSTHEVIRHPIKSGSNLYEAYGEAFTKAEAAGWGDDYFFRYELKVVICHRLKPE